MALVLEITDFRTGRLYVIGVWFFMCLLIHCLYRKKVFSFDAFEQNGDN